MAVRGAGLGDSASLKQWCATVEETFKLIENPPDPADATSVSDLQATVDHVNDLQDRMVSEAPDDIRDDVRIVMTTDSNTIRLSEKDALEKSNAKVNKYLQDKCDLAVGV